MSRYKLAIDIGGTFIDVVICDAEEGALRTFKLPTTPDDPARGVIAALDMLGVPMVEVGEFIHGTTLGLNAILERKGTCVGIIATEGFSDIIEIGRGSLEFADMYRFDYAPPPPIVERRNRRGVPGRMNFQGEEVTPLDRDAVVAAARDLQAQGCRAIAVSFLHSYANDSQERAAIAAIRAALPEMEVSAGALLANEYREYERTSTAMLDAYIKPVLRNYLGRVSGGLAQAGFTGARHVMNSSGGALTFDLAEEQPIATVLSGPAGGVSGALHVARATGRANVLSVDVGGTSLDACLIVNGNPVDVFEARIDVFPVLQPIFDLRTLGAGGGSIASVDNRLLRVGPASAGAVPGPACYGRGGTAPTVTDAALILGYMEAGNFMGGDMKLALDLAAEALQSHVCDPLNIPLEEGARAIFDVLISRTASSIKEMMLERGLDPRDFSLLAMGGCGPLLGPMLMSELGMPELVVPPLPSVFSAWGMLVSDLTFTDHASILETVSDAAMAKLRVRAEALQARSVEKLGMALQRSVAPHAAFSARLRFIGQEHTLSIPCAPTDSADALFTRFTAAHQDRFGHSFDSAAEIVSLMIKLMVETSKPGLQGPVGPGRPAARHRMFDRATNRMTECQKHDRAALAPGTRLDGPVLIYDEGSSLAVPGSQTVTVDSDGMLSVTAKEV
jgi:N-methylhydantoinase A